MGVTLECRAVSSKKIELSESVGNRSRTGDSSYLERQWM